MCKNDFEKSKNHHGKIDICDGCREIDYLALQILSKSKQNSGVGVGADSVDNKADYKYNTRNGPMLEQRKEFEKHKEELIESVWNKGKIINGKDPNKYREDKMGNVIYKSSYGKDSAMGWNIDHSKPIAKDGTNHLNNLQPLQTAQNKSKNATYPYNYDEAEPKGVSRYDMIKTDVDKRSSLVRNKNVLFNYDGTIDARCKAVRSGEIVLNKDKTINKNSIAVKSGAIRIKPNDKPSLDVVQNSTNQNSRTLESQKYVNNDSTHNKSNSNQKKDYDYYSPPTPSSPKKYNFYGKLLIIHFKLK
jgi:hypothetical protein